MDDDAIIAFEKGEINNSEVNPENVAKAEAWEASMEDAPAFSGFSAESTAGDAETNSESTVERNEVIANASASLPYINGISLVAGVETTMGAVKNLDLDNSENPVGDLLVMTGLNTEDKINDVRNANAQSATEVSDFFNNDVNATRNDNERTIENAKYALRNLQEMIEWAETSMACEKLRNEAYKKDKGLYEYAAEGKPEAGMVEVFRVLGQQKEEKPAEEKPVEENSVEEEPVEEKLIEENPAEENPEEEKPIEENPAEEPKEEQVEEQLAEGLVQAQDPNKEDWKEAVA